MADPDSVSFIIGYFFAQQGQSASFQPFLYENAGYQKSGKRRKQETVDQQPAAEAGFYRRSGVVGIGPVSYTHLDVYKRQGYLFCDEMITDTPC